MGRLRPSATVALLFTAVCQPFVAQGFVPGPSRCCTQHRLSTPRLSADPSEPQFDKYGLPLDYMPENQRRKIDFKVRDHMQYRWLFSEHLWLRGVSTLT
jgi:hypothetical protein